MEILMEAQIVGFLEMRCRKILLYSGEFPRALLHDRFICDKSKILCHDDIHHFFCSHLSAMQKQYLDSSGDVFTSLQLAHRQLRVYLFYQNKKINAVIWPVGDICSFRDLGLSSSMCRKIFSSAKGMVVVAGESGSGRSTTIAAALDYINDNYGKQILTIENPIEFIHSSRRCMVWQREVGKDVQSIERALQSRIVRSSDVIYVSEVCNEKEMSLLLTLAHSSLVLLHISAFNSLQAIKKILGLYSPVQHEVIRRDLSFVLKAVFVQQLVPSVDGRRALAVETLIMEPVYCSFLRENRIERIFSAIAVGRRLVFRMDYSLFDLYYKNIITKETLLLFCHDPDGVIRNLKKWNKH